MFGKSIDVKKINLVILLYFLFSMTIFSQNQEWEVSGIITDENNLPLPGVNVVVSGTTYGSITDFDGKYRISASGKDTLVFSFIGYNVETRAINNQTNINLQLSPSLQELEQVVVVGYGVQKKESVVGSIVQAKGSDLMKSGGVSTVGEALQGKLPGVTTIYSNSTPGENEPLIFIRGQSSWNGSGQPLILVDGMERSMSNIDLNEIENMSVLKDASATAVFGVKGANGVILINTKRGKEGKAKLSFSANTTLKAPSKLPKRVDSYDAILLANESIEREMLYNPNSWNNYIPLEIADKYRNPANELERMMYPNVDWEDAILKDYAMDNRVNLSVRGGSKVAKYFTSFSYQHVSDIFDSKSYDNGKGYESEFSYDRFNYRSNLDFDITRSTRFTVNLSGYYGNQNKPADGNKLSQILGALYQLSPSIYYPRYPDGSYGMDPSESYETLNPLVMLSSLGATNQYKFQINSDFVFDQKLDFLTKGLNFKAKLSMDNNMTATRSIRDGINTGLPRDNVVYKYYDADGNEFFVTNPGINDFDFAIAPWTLNDLSVNNGSRSRRLFYQMSFDYSRVFGNHSTSALFLFNREEFAIGNMFPRYREDWVSRLTYGYDTRYFIDINGAYNGSEKFSDDYRFELFPSAALGWMISNESFMKGLSWLNKLKVRGSYGLVGDDNFSGRWRYMTQWGSGGNAYLVPSNFGNNNTPYTFYSETVLGNYDLHWETALKSNIGFELAVLDRMFSLDLDFFRENRKDIMLVGADRSIHDIIGAAPPDANSGEVDVKGMELILKEDYKFGNGLRLWTTFSYTYAVDKIISKEDPFLRADYLKEEGFPISSNKAPIPGDILTSWDDIYMSVPLVDGQYARRPGYYDMMDYNADGDFQSAFDNAPYGYSNRPQKTWFLSIGTDYKGFSFSVDLYGAQNATRFYQTRNFQNQHLTYFDHSLDYWSVNNPSGSWTLSPYSLNEASTNNNENYYDASLVRLKTIELAYSIPKALLKKSGVDQLRIFVNGNNLYLWTDLPDDREFNGGNVTQSSFRGNYPTLKRINFGFNLNF